LEKSSQDRGPYAQFEMPTRHYLESFKVITLDESSWGHLEAEKKLDFVP
jgi:hypothetical protein